MVQPRALSVSDVQKAFAAEGLALLRNALGNSSGMPVTLISRGALPLFSAIVYASNSVSASLGIRVSDSQHLVVRVPERLDQLLSGSQHNGRVQAA